MSNFRRVLAGARTQEVIIPLLRAALFNPTFPAFKIGVDEWVERPPDGYFHPSTHPSWTERMLFFYLTRPDELVPEPFDPHSIMAMVQGTFWHKFLQNVLMDMGALNAVEVEFEDAGTRAKGSLDGIVNSAKLSIEEDEVFELKTMAPQRLNRLAKGVPQSPEVVESFRDLDFPYYLQGQEYMRISGYRRWRGLFLGLVYPFPMREVVMDYDHAVGQAIAERYRRVLALVEQSSNVDALQPCCGVRSKDAAACSARTICPIGRM